MNSVGSFCKLIFWMSSFPLLWLTHQNLSKFMWDSPSIYCYFVNKLSVKLFVSEITVGFHYSSSISSIFYTFAYHRWKLRFVKQWQLKMNLLICDAIICGNHSISYWFNNHRQKYISDFILWDWILTYILMVISNCILL